MTSRFVLVVTVATAGAALLVVSACSSSSSSDAPPAPTCNDKTTPTDLTKCPADPFDASIGTSTKISKCGACERFVGALLAKAEQLHCSLSPTPRCPDVLDSFEADQMTKGKCVQGYSDETISNCECRINTFTTCADFSSKRCMFGDIVDCPTDAGADGDAVPDTSAFDSPSDSGDAGGGG